MTSSNLGRRRGAGACGSSGLRTAAAECCRAHQGRLGLPSSSSAPARCVPALAGQEVFEADGLKTGADGRRRGHAERRHAPVPRPRQRSAARSVCLRSGRRPDGTRAQGGARRHGLRVRSDRQALARLDPARDAGRGGRRPWHDSGACTSYRNEPPATPCRPDRDRRGGTWCGAAGPRHVRTQARPGQDLVVLLPDPAMARRSRGRVDSCRGRGARGRARIDAGPLNKPLAPVVVMSEADAQQLFGDALTALPPAAERFTLYFRFESDELTDESRALVPQILQAVKGRPFPDVAVIGHTDTTGTPAGNFELGLRRANAIRSNLIGAQVSASDDRGDFAWRSRPPDQDGETRSSSRATGASKSRSDEISTPPPGAPVRARDDARHRCPLALSPARCSPNLDYSAYDALIRTARTQPPGGQIVIVDVDERSLSAIGQWPWRRDRHRHADRPHARARRVDDRARHHLRRSGPLRRQRASRRTKGWPTRSARGGVVLGYAMTFDRPRGPARPRACSIRSRWP